MTSRPAWLPYVAPMLLFLILTGFEGRFGRDQYPLLYTVKVVLVGIVTAACWRGIPEARLHSRGVGIAVVLGVVLTAAWVLIDRFTPHFAFLGTRESLDPFTQVHPKAWVWPFLFVRFAGLVLLVPVVEEIFWRGWLLRFLIRFERFRDVPIGTYEATSFGGVVLMMSLAHPEWLSAAIFSAAMNLLLYRTKNLFACIVAHATTNLCLGLYVLASGDWKYW